MLLGLSYQQIAVGLGIFVVSTLASTGVVVAYLVSIRPDHFVTKPRGVARRMTSHARQVAWAVGKNLLGAALLLIGIFLSLPGVPGQGLLTILVGLLMLDIPGKRRLELGIVRRRAIRHGIDRLRARFAKPPLMVDGLGVERGSSERGSSEQSARGLDGDQD